MSAPWISFKPSTRRNGWGVIRKAHPWERIDRGHEKHYLARGRVFKQGDTWCMEVRVGNRVVVTDNTNHWRTILDSANECVFAFDRVTSIGHKIKRSYAELVRGAR